MNTPLQPPVPPPTPVIAPAAPVTSSQVQLANTVAFVCGVAALAPKNSLVVAFHLTNPALVETYITNVMGVASLASIAWSFIARQLSKVQPLTWTKQAAATHVNTEAVAKVQALMKTANIPTAANVKTQLVNNGSK
jgi:hypothetical protein